MRITRRDVRMGVRPPWYYGVAYYHPTMDHMVCYPIPINWMVRFSRDLFFFVKIPSPGYYEKREGRIRHEAYEKGYRAGRDLKVREEIMGLFREARNDSPMRKTILDSSKKVASIIEKEKKPC